MAVDGNWNITLSTPMGERKTTLSVKTAGGALNGTQGADGNSTEIFDGTANGDDVAWKVSITNPMPLTLARAVHWFVENDYCKPRFARRIRAHGVLEQAIHGLHVEA